MLIFTDEFNIKAMVTFYSFIYDVIDWDTDIDTLLAPGNILDLETFNF